MSPQPAEEEGRYDASAVEDRVLVNDGVIRDVHEHIYQCDGGNGDWRSELDRPYRVLDLREDVIGIGIADEGPIAASAEIRGQYWQEREDERTNQMTL